MATTGRYIEGQLVDSGCDCYIYCKQFQECIRNNSLNIRALDTKRAASLPLLKLISYLNTSLFPGRLACHLHADQSPL